MEHGRPRRGREAPSARTREDRVRPAIWARRRRQETTIPSRRRKRPREGIVKFSPGEPGKSRRGTPPADRRVSESSGRNHEGHEGHEVSGQKSAGKRRRTVRNFFVPVVPLRFRKSIRLVRRRSNRRANPPTRAAVGFAAGRQNLAAPPPRTFQPAARGLHCIRDLVAQADGLQSRGRSSVGRAPRSQCGGRGFDSHRLQSTTPLVT